MTMQETAVKSLDAVSYGTVVATVAGVLPPIAALFSIVWICVQLADRWSKHRARTNSRKRRSTDV